MRVLHLHSGNQFGGIERLLVTLAQSGVGAPAPLKHTFGLCFGGRLADELTRAGGRVVLLGRTRLGNPRSVLRARRAARQAIAVSTPDILLTHLPWARVVFGPVLREGAAPDVRWVHGCSPRAGWLERLAGRHAAAACIYNSAFTASICAGRCGDVLSRVFYNPVKLPDPVESRGVVRTRYDTDAESVVITQSSRMEQWKGHLDLIDAARLLRASPRWVIWFAGGPQTKAQARYYRQLQDHAIRAGLMPHVRFLGEVTDVSSVLHASDIFCQPNRVGEPFGIVFVEAMSAGLPVVATSIGAAPELTGGNGFLVRPCDPAALAEALQKLVSNAADRCRAGRAGRARAAVLGDPEIRGAELAAFLAEVRTQA